MENLVPGLVVFYLLYSVVSALFKRAAQEPTRGEFGEVETVSPYETEHEPAYAPVFETVQPEQTRTPTISADTFDVERVETAGLNLAAADGMQGDALSGDSEVEPLQAYAQVSPAMERTEMTHLRRLLATQDGLRRAVLLAEVLGPPKALRNRPIPPRLVR